MTKKTKSQNFDEKFDRGEDVTQYLEPASANRLNTDTKRVNIDFPVWVVECLDKEARRLGITRQSLVKVWIAEKFSSVERQ